MTLNVYSHLMKSDNPDGLSDWKGGFSIELSQRRKGANRKTIDPFCL